MIARSTPLLASCAFFVLANSVACGSDKGLSPSTSTNPIPNPSGPRALGDLLTLNVNGTEPCSNPVYHTARVVAVGSKALILADTLNPKNGFTTADYERYAARFDTLVYPLDVANFGEPTDIDKNGKVAILFTIAVNQLTPAKAGQYVGGFAYSRDLFPKEGTTRAQACAGSNEGEYFYAMAPDPLGSINENVRSKGFVDSSTVPVLAHEFQHIINASRRLYVNFTPAFEDKWLDEGLAHTAEELLFFREAGLTPRSNLDVNALRATTAAKNAYNLDEGGNASRLRVYLQSPNTNSPYAVNDSLGTRGAAQSFLRYAIDRANATDGFLAGGGDALVGTGDITLTSSLASATWMATVVNTSLVGGSTTDFSLKFNYASTDLVPTVPLSSDVIPTAIVPDDPAVIRRDVAFESRLRDSERRVLTPLMGAARAWYAASDMPSPATSQSRALLATAFADADATSWFKLVNGPEVGIANLQSVIGTNVAQFVRDWSVSHAVDDVAELGTQFQQRSWNWHSIYPNLGTTISSYPLLFGTLSASGTASGSVLAGGATFYRINAAPNAKITVTLSAPAGAVNPNLQLIIVRTK